VPGNPFGDPALVEGYESWYRTTGRRADRLEKALLQRLLARFPQARTILEVGCGTGHFSRWFRGRGLQVIGLDLARPMLAEAARLGSPPCARGDGLALPFSGGAFDLVALVTALEFVPGPDRALAEALRVARQGVILGVLNGHSVLGRRLKHQGGPVWGVARFYTPGELVRLVRCVAAGKPIALHWRTTLWPLWPTALPLPWGAFIGMAIELQ
jgi:ubiquinone/menaquinone biosynthesis C-methylase UbiE